VLKRNKERFNKHKYFIYSADTFYLRNRFIFKLNNDNMRYMLTLQDLRFILARLKYAIERKQIIHAEESITKLLLLRDEVLNALFEPKKLYSSADEIEHFSKRVNEEFRLLLIKC